MKKPFLSLTFILLAATGLLSCKKNNSTTAAQQSTADGQTMTTFMQNHGPQSENFTVDASTGAVITSSKGTQYTIPGGAFQTAAGAAVTGSVTVSIKEINNPADMILSDRPTLTRDGQMLISYGEFNINAAQNNQALQLKKDSVIRVAVQAKPNGQEVPLWSGDSSITTTLSGYDYLNVAVTLSLQTSVHRGIVWDQQASAYAFFNGSNGTLNFSMDSLSHWVNCDQITQVSGPKTTVLGYFSSHYNIYTGTDYSGDQPTMLYFKPHNQNTLIKLYDIILNAPTGYQGLLSYQASVPIGLQGTFLAMSTINGKFYADMQDVTIPSPTGSNNYTTFTFNPQEVSESTMVSMITQMNSK